MTPTPPGTSSAVADNSAETKRIEELLGFIPVVSAIGSTTPDHVCSANADDRLHIKMRCECGKYVDLPPPWRKETPDEALEKKVAAVIQQECDANGLTSAWVADRILNAIRPHLAFDTEVLDALADATAFLRSSLKGQTGAFVNAISTDELPRFDAILKARGR